nr:hypothetical protein [Tanacetum cinerariifolium]
MADVNAPFDQTPTMAPLIRVDDQILPHIRWIPIGKSNCYLDLEKSKTNPVYKIAVDLLKNTNFFKAFTASSDLPSIYIQWFWDMILYDKKAGCYKEKEGHSDCDSKCLVHQVDHPPSLEEARATGTTDKPAKSKRIKRSVSHNTRQSRGSPKFVGALEAEEVPSEEPQVVEEDADFQKAVEESMKDAYALHKGSLPPVVIREPESGKYQPLPEVPGKDKAKVCEEQVVHDLLSLQKHKKTSPADKYIFQRRVSEPTASSFHDVSPYEVLGQPDSEEESEKVVLGVKKGSQDEGQAGPDPNAQVEGQTGSDTGAQAEGQAGSNTDETFEGQAGSNPDESAKCQAGPDPGNVEARVQSTSIPVVHVGSDRNHMDTDVANVSLQPSTEKLYEGFTATIYPNVQENLKLSVEEPVLLEEPASSSGTLSSLLHLIQSMVNVLIQQALSYISLMTSPIIDLTSRAESPKEHLKLKATTTDTTTTTTTTLPPPQAPQQHMTEVMMVKRIALEKSINHDQSEELAYDLAEARKRKKKSRELPKMPHGSPSHQPPPLHLPAGPSGTSRAPRASGSQVTPPPPPPPTSTNQDSPSTGSAVPSPKKTVATTEHQAWAMPDVTLKPLVSLTPKDLDLDEAMDSLLAQTGDITSFMDWFCKRRGITELKPQDLEGPAYEIVKSYLRYGSKGRRPALSISKMKAAYYPDAGLEQMVPDQFWIEEECKYDIAAMYGISHWWFQRQRFYIDRHASE